LVAGSREWGLGCRGWGATHETKLEDSEHFKVHVLSAPLNAPSKKRNMK
jgi:hypothetical protein